METHTWLTTVELVYLVVVFMGLIQLAGVLSSRFRLSKLKRRKNWSSAAEFFTSCFDQVVSIPWHCKFIGSARGTPFFLISLLFFPLQRRAPLMREIFLLFSGCIYWLRCPASNPSVVIKLPQQQEKSPWDITPKGHINTSPHAHDEVDPILHFWFTVMACLWAYPGCFSLLLLWHG